MQVREEISNVGQLRAGREFSFTAGAAADDDNDEVVEEEAADVDVADVPVQEELVRDFSSDFAATVDEAHSAAADEARAVRQFSDLEEQARHLHPEEEVAADDDQVAEEVEEEGVELAVEEEFPAVVVEEEVVAAEQKLREGRQFTDDDAVDGEGNSLVEEEGEVEVTLPKLVIDTQTVEQEDVVDPVVPVVPAEPLFVVVVKEDTVPAADVEGDAVLPLVVEEEAAPAVAVESEDVAPAIAVESEEITPAEEEVPSEELVVAAEEVPVLKLVVADGDAATREESEQIPELKALDEALKEMEEVSDAIRHTDKLMESVEDTLGEEITETEVDEEVVEEVADDVLDAVLADEPVEEIVTVDDPGVRRGVGDDEAGEGQDGSADNAENDEGEGESFLSPIIRILRL